MISHCHITYLHISLGISHFQRQEYIFLHYSSVPSGDVAHVERPILRGIFQGSLATLCATRPWQAEWKTHGESRAENNNYGKQTFLMGKSIISMAMFNSKLFVYQRVNVLQIVAFCHIVM